MSIAIDTEKARKRTHALKHRAFHGWSEHVFVARRARVRMERAERFHTVELLQRRVLRGWFRVAMQQVCLHCGNGFALRCSRCVCVLRGWFHVAMQQVRDSVRAALCCNTACMCMSRLHCRWPPPSPCTLGHKKKRGAY